MQATDILKVINGAGFIAVPMIAAFFGLDWYFKRGQKGTKAVFIAVGGILSAVLYSYFAWTEPGLMLINTSILWYFGLAALAVAVYYGLYNKYNGEAATASAWLLPGALLSYICLLSAVGIFCAAALARHDYLLVGGTVFSGDKSLPGATLIMQGINHVTLRQTQSNAAGRYLLTLKYSDYENGPDYQKPAYLLVKASGYSERLFPLDGHPNENFDVSLAAK